jgi:hypothetical protein
VEFINHIEKEHAMGSAEYCYTFALCSTLTVLHQCHICFNQINHDYQTLKEHTMGQHSIYLKYYYFHFIHDEIVINAQLTKTQDVHRPAQDVGDEEYAKIETL